MKTEKQKNGKKKRVYSKAFNSGIQVGDSIKITSNEKESTGVLLQIFRFLIIWSGIVIILSNYFSVFNLKIDYFTLHVGIILATVYYFTLFFFRDYMRFTIPTTFVIFSAVIYHYRKIFINGFYHIENSFIYFLNEYLDSNFSYYESFVDQKIGVTFFFLMLAQLFALSLALSVFYGKIWIYLPFSLVLIGLSFTIGYVPDTLFFFFYIIHLSILYTMHQIPEKGSGASGTYLEDTPQYRQDYKQTIRLKIGILTALLGIFLFLVLRAVISPKLYEESVNMDNIRSNIKRTITEVSNDNFFNYLSDMLGGIRFEDKMLKFGDNNLASGGLDGGSIEQASEVKFSNSVVLKLIVPDNISTLYLKGYVGSNYTGIRWEPLSKEQKKQYAELEKTFGNSSLSAVNQWTSWLSLFTQMTYFEGSKIKDMESSLNSAALKKLLIRKSTMEIFYYGANKDFVYAPYETDFSHFDEGSPYYDLYVSPKNKKDHYLFDFYLPQYNLGENPASYFRSMVSLLSEFSFSGNTKEWISYQKFEMAYREFVYNTYLNMPKGMEQLERLDLGLQDAHDLDSVFKIVDSVIAFLASNTSYSLKPGPLPKGKDYVNYFLFENRIGYCAHYASAAVLLFRRNGIPARYVEGYIMTKEDINNGKYTGTWSEEKIFNSGLDSTSELIGQKSVEIRDTNAHAWVEIYLDGFGWMPVEVTAGYSSEPVIHDLEEEIKNQIKPEQSPNILPKPTKQAEPTLTLTPIPTQKPTVIPNANPLGPADLTDQGGKEKSSVSFSKLWKTIPAGVRLLVITVIFLLIVKLLFMARRKLVIDYRKKKELKCRINDRILLNYFQIERILKCNGVSSSPGQGYKQFSEEAADKKKGLIPSGFSEIMDIVLNARFSNSQVSETELDLVKSYKNDLIRRFYYKSNLIKKWYLYYWLVV